MDKGFWVHQHTGTFCDEVRVPFWNQGSLSKLSMSFVLEFWLSVDFEFSFIILETLYGV